MSDNYIIHTQELEVFENYLKCLSEELQKEYREEGKYLYIGLAVELGMTTLLPFIFVVLFFPLIDYIRPFQNAVFNISLILLCIVGMLFLVGIIVTNSDNFKLPIISKKRFLNQNQYSIREKLNEYDLTFEDVIIDNKNLEISLNKDNYKSMKRLKIQKRNQKIGGQNER